MIITLSIIVSLLVVAGLGALLQAVRSAPEGVEIGEGFVGRPDLRTASRREEHPVTLHGTALLH